MHLLKRKKQLTVLLRGVGPWYWGDVHLQHTTKLLFIVAVPSIEARYKGWELSTVTLSCTQGQLTVIAWLIMWHWACKMCIILVVDDRHCRDNSPKVAILWAACSVIAGVTKIHVPFCPYDLRPSAVSTSSLHSKGLVLFYHFRSK